MREDMGLFRGKRIADGEWVEGCLVITRVGTFIATQKDIDWSVITSDGIFDGDMTPVHPATVGECVAGLKDKNGKRIFEGDIVANFNEWGRIIDHLGVVEFGGFNCSCCGGVYGWYLDNEDTDIRGARPIYGDGLLVAGNIHDNPELLEG